MQAKKQKTEAVTKGRPATDKEEELDDTADIDVVGSDTQDDDKEGDEEDTDPHCTINYVANTVYTLIDMNSKDKVWATCAFTDPAPAIPDHLTQHHPGDYVRIKGRQLNPKSHCKMIFETQQGLILDADWHPFPEDMSAQDLVDLGALEFHLWWQCIQEPKVKKVPAKAATKTGTKGKKRR